MKHYLDTLISSVTYAVPSVEDPVLGLLVAESDRALDVVLDLRLRGHARELLRRRVVDRLDALLHSTRRSLEVLPAGFSDSVVVQRRSQLESFVAELIQAQLSEDVACWRDLFQLDVEVRAALSERYRALLPLEALGERKAL